MIAVSKQVRCCIECDECSDCYTHTLYDLRELLLAIKVEVSTFAKEYAQIKNWGYGCTTITEEAVKHLLSYKKAILHYYHNLRQGAMMCLCNHEFQRIKERVLRLVNMRKCREQGAQDIRYDDSGLDAWTLTNPRCIAFDDWERSLLGCMKPTFNVSVEVENVEKAKRVLHALVVREDNAPDRCIMEVFAYVHKAQCEYDAKSLGVTVDMQKCEREVKALIEKYNCNLTVNAYAELIKCNLTFNVVASILGCGGKFTFDKDGNATVKIGTLVSKVTDLVSLSGGAWPEGLNEAVYQEMYG